MTASPAFEVRLLRQAECRALPIWRGAFGALAKDHRYHEIVADTLGEDFDCRGLVIHDQDGVPVAVQPCFFVEQDLLATAPAVARSLVARLRRRWPRLLRLRMLMIGCAAGEGHPVAAPHLRVLAGTLPAIARAHGAALVVWKDIPSSHRGELLPLAGTFTRIASLPATRLALDFADFDDYLAHQLSHAMRKNLRRKFRDLAGRPPLEMTVTSSVAEAAEEVHALYLQVFARSSLRFEKLTTDFLRELGRRMPDRVRFFQWREEGRLVACSLCLVHDGVLYDEYLGLDYRRALDRHLYFVTFRDLCSWALREGLRAYRSTPLSYDPKLHLGFRLAPLDLYVAPAANWARPLLRLVLPWIQPTRTEPLLRRFANADEI